MRRCSAASTTWSTASPTPTSLYAPKMIAVSTTCMAEVIGDDLQSLHRDRQDQGLGAAGLRRSLRPYARLRRQPRRRLRQHDQGRARQLLEGQGARAERAASTSFRASTASVVGNNREIKRILDLMGVDYTLLSDAADQFDTPADGEFRMFDGGTTHRGHRGGAQRQGDDLAAGIVHAQDLGLLRRARASRPRRSTIRSGVAATDELLMKVAELIGQGDPGGDREGARPPDRRDGRQPVVSARQEIRDLRRSGLRLRDGALRHGDRRRADPLPGDQRHAEVGRGDEARCSPPRRSAPTPRSGRARICGTCARCCSPSRSIS